MRTKEALWGIPKWILLLFVMLVIFVPVLWIFISAFKSKVEIIAYPPTFFTTNLTIGNFTMLFKKLPIVTYIKNSLTYVLLLVVCQMSIDTLAAYAFARMDFKGKHVLFTVILASMMIPFQVIMIPLFWNVRF